MIPLREKELAEALVAWARAARVEAAKLPGPNGLKPDTLLYMKACLIEVRALEIRRHIMRL